MAVLQKFYGTGPGNSPGSTLFKDSPLAHFLHQFMKKTHPAVLLLFLAGLGVSLVQIFRKEEDRNQSVYHYMIFATLVMYTLMFTVFFSLSRYSVPLRPELYIAASWTLHTITRLFLGTRRT